MEEIWIHHIDIMGDSDDYSVYGYDAVAKEVTNIIHWGIGYCCPVEVQDQIKNLIESGDWRQAMQMFNEHSAMQEHIEIREGKRVNAP